PQHTTVSPPTISQQHNHEARSSCPPGARHQVLAAPTAETRDDSSGKSLGTITTKAEYLALHANHRLVHNNGNFIALDVGTNDFWQVGDPLLSDVKSAWTSFTPPTTSVKRDAVSLEGKRDSPGSYCNGGHSPSGGVSDIGCP
ncbi:uncharacterized protein EHS24_005456, partial [Apiotrichum porosum]